MIVLLRAPKVKYLFWPQVQRAQPSVMVKTLQ